jgi:menaquinone-9 beta-reductase
MAADLDSLVSGHPDAGADGARVTDDADRADVAIVGGSLAGSAAAAALARQGARVIVLEKACFPRARICGEFLSSAARPHLARLGILQSILDAGAETIDRFSIVRENGHRVEAPLPSPVLSISRETLDTLASDAARKLGAEIRFGVTVLSIEGSLAEGFVLCAPNLRLHSRVVVGAWGRYTPLDGRLGRDFFGSPAPLFGFKKHLAGPGAQGLRGRVVLHLFPGGYLGLSRVEGGKVNLAALVQPRVAHEAHHDFDRLLERLRAASPSLDRDLADLAPEPGPVLVSEPVHLGRRSPVTRDVLFVGDAAGVLDPYTGTGMSNALETGNGAAATILDFLSGTTSPEILCAAHVSALRRISGRRFLWSRLFRPFFGGSALSRLLLPAASPLARIAARLTSP